jgi:hypothetical protein
MYYLKRLVLFFVFCYVSTISIAQNAATTAQDIADRKLGKTIFKKDVEPLFLQKVSPIYWKTIEDNIHKKYTAAGKIVLGTIKEKFIDQIRTVAFELCASTITDYPDSSFISHQLQKRFPDYDHRQLQLEVAVHYYYSKDIYAECEKAAGMLLHKYADKLTADQINDICWAYILVIGSSRSAFKEAVAQMAKIIVKEDPDYLDTYANLLYKSGDTIDALQWEEKAIELASKPDAGPRALKGVVANKEKMQKGEKTWMVDLLPAQKKSLDYAAISEWPTITSQKISNDGKYLFYTVYTRSNNKLIVKSTTSYWYREFNGIKDVTFTNNNPLLVFGIGKDSVGVLNLELDSLWYLKDVSSYELNKGNYDWLAYQSNSFSNELIVRNLTDGSETHYANISAYSFSPVGNALIIQKETSQKDILSLYYLDLASLQLKNIGKYNGITNIIFDQKGTQFAFLTNRSIKNSLVPVFYHYQFGRDSATLLLSPLSKGMENMSIVERGYCFSQSGDKFFFHIKQQEVQNKIENNRQTTARVKVLNYKDDSIQFIKKSRNFLAVLNLKNRDTVIRLSQHKDITISDPNETNNSDYLLATSNYFGNQAEYKWRKSAIPDLYLISTSDGQRKLLKHSFKGGNCKFSPTGKYLIWYDAQKRHWCTYDIIAMTERIITAKIPTLLYHENDFPDLPRPIGLAGWLEKDSSVLIYDQYDIWKVDPKGMQTPVCITNYYGNKNHIRLKYMNLDRFHDKVFHFQDTLILTAFDTDNKYSGFFELSTGSDPSLRKLIMSPKTYFPGISPNFNGLQRSTFPVKARDTNLYIISQMSSTDFINLYTTTDFSHFKSVSNLVPQQKYNWYTTELVEWKLENGRKERGILYKPEDFDPHKKYPIIFHFYEQNADGIYQFINPSLSNGVINIPWYASNGYLIFVPDIHYEMGYPGQSAYNSVVSAAKYLSKYLWVNSKKMGLQGHSFGGFETNYIISHCSLFAAAATSAGMSNIISEYGRMPTLERSQWYYEVRQGRIGASLWENPKLYIENSPVFNADKVTTPLFIMHNKNDYNVLFTQGTEWYCNLTRLNKKVWMVSYEDESHTIENYNNQLDYSIRLQQFFDHYLKDAPAPLWMTQGILLQNTTHDDGLGIDGSGTMP